MIWKHIQPEKNKIQINLRNKFFKKMYVQGDYLFMYLESYTVGENIIAK